MRSGETIREADWLAIASRAAGILVLIAGVILGASLCGASTPADHPVPSIFDPHSAPSESIGHLSQFVFGMTGLIFLVVFCLLSYVVVKFRSRVAGSKREPAQMHGSKQIELARTVIPILIVAVLFLATAPVIHRIQDAPRPAGAVKLPAIGYQFWWEFRYPGLCIVTANVLHVRTALEDGSVVAELELIDRHAMKLLAINEANGIELRHFPAYIREWIRRERDSS